MNRQNAMTILGLLIILIGGALWFQLGSISLKNQDTPLKIGMCPNAPPFEGQTASGHPTGASVALADALGEYLGMPLEIVSLPQKSLETSLKSNKIDLIFSSCSTPSKCNGLCYSKPYAKTPLAMLAYKDSAVHAYASLDSPEVIIAVTASSQAAHWAAFQASKAQIKLLSSNAKAINEVAQGNADVFISDPITVIHAQESYSDSTIAYLEPLPNTRGWSIAANKTNIALIERINNFIDLAQGDGTFEMIRKTYLKDQIEEYQKYHLDYFF